MATLDPDDKRWIISHLDDRLTKVEEKITGFVTWRALGTAVAVAFGLVGLILSFVTGVGSG